MPGCMLVTKLCVTAVSSWQTDMCPLVNIPKFYWKHRFNSAPSNHERICKLVPPFSNIICDLALHYFTLSVSFI